MKLSELPVGTRYTYPEGAEDAGETFIVREHRGSRVPADEDVIAI